MLRLAAALGAALLLSAAANPAWESARTHAAAGRLDAALDALEAAFAAGETDNESPRLDAGLAALHAHPRFRAILDANTSRAAVRVAPPGEPGEPIVVRGIVTGPDGTPLAGARVFVHHTDVGGLYNADGGPDPRLFGSMLTGEDGRFEYRTIRPASYPGSRIPQHVHTRVTAPGHRERLFELLFADDPLGRPRGGPHDVVAEPGPPGEDGRRVVECPVALEPGAR